MAKFVLGFKLLNITGSGGVHIGSNNQVTIATSSGTGNAIIMDTDGIQIIKVTSAIIIDVTMALAML